ncbi:MAG: protein kinase [Actinomycetota bacterium]
MIQTTIAGRYRLEEQIATGGMGTVWRAHDEVLQRPVAVKLLNDHLADDDAASERFRREALTAASITHPNMANVYDYVEDQGRPGIVMELVDGETLAHLIARRGRLPVKDAVRIACDVLVALDAAHAAGIIHRDVKPGNILITSRGEVKVGDFGIARSLSDSSMTATGTVMGTAHYSAPEQVRGESAGPPSDIYSVGVVLYEMLAGRRPFQGDTAVAVALARLSEDPPSPRTLRPALPQQLDALVMRALARDPAARFSGAREMRNALTAAVTGDDEASRTMVFAATSDADTVAYGVAAAPALSEEPPIVRDFVPPRWAGRKVALILLPLLVLGLIAFLLVGSLRSSPAVKAQSPTTPSASARPVTCCRVPSLKGLTIPRANNALKAAGLDMGNVTYVYSSAPNGTVVGQSPAATKTIARGEAVALVVSRGPAPPPAPSPKHHKRHGD